MRFFLVMFCLAFTCGMLQASYYQPSACISDGRDSRNGLDLNSSMMTFVAP